MLRLDRPVQHQVHHVESSQHQHRLADNQLPDVTMDMVSQFVRQHNLDLIRRVAVQHGIAYDNPPRISQPHQSGVSSRRLVAHLHGENAAHTRMSAFGQCQ